MKGSMKVVGYVLGSVVGLALLAVGVGFLLPVRHSETFSRVVAGTPQDVWNTITTVEDFDTWRTDIERSERLEPIEGWPAWREVGPSGAITLSMEAIEPPNRLVARIVQEGVSFGGTLTYELAPASGGTLVTVTDEGVISNPIVRLVARFAPEYENTMQRYLDGLEARMGSAR